MTTEQLKLIHEAQEMARDLVDGFNSTKLNFDSIKSSIVELDELVEKLQEFEDVEGFLELDSIKSSIVELDETVEKLEEFEDDVY